MIVAGAVIAFILIRRRRAHPVVAGAGLPGAMPAPGPIASAPPVASAPPFASVRSVGSPPPVAAVLRPQVQLLSLDRRTEGPAHRTNTACRIFPAYRAFRTTIPLR